ncbi:MAG: UvrD-helicase domain-containing protein [Paracoccaceae bacterium]|jgi:DNA helicase-2/ATP-dependent DNA helicase PcrA|nr:UvrD-helicase domain-containing protein [Paracoccaceae bacterium]|tara:strand:- start:8475 stop:10799 length:2325 start_codon:yes stop_codon:yes gene_type:complete
MSNSLSAQASAARSRIYLDSLNNEQRKAVEEINGPVLMLAGAGTGKTRALITRIIHILNLRKANPNEILAVTFTNKAAREMKNRIQTNVGDLIEGMTWVGTFHSICVKMLRTNAELVGLKSNFTIIDTDDQLRLLKQLIQAENIDEKRWPPRMLAHIIDNWKNRALRPDNIPNIEASLFNERGEELYGFYQQRLKTLNAVDFGDLLLHMVTILQNNSDILARYQKRFKYILVDEYQDTNVAQYLWLRLLASSHQNICCVGDDDQSIYGWRGAEVGNILKFENDFKNSCVIRLEQNYRSTEHILGAASHLINGNKERLGKTLWTAQEGGNKVKLIGHWDGDEEARWIGDEIESAELGNSSKEPVSPENMAILVRASHQMRAFEDRFMTIGLPYRVIGGPRFYERAEIRDAMAYFRAAVSRDDGLALQRIVNKPKRGIGEKAQQKLNIEARERNISLLDAARSLCEKNSLTGRAQKELKILIGQLDHWHQMSLDQTINHIELAEIILEESGYTDMWRNEKTPEAPGRLENLKELVKALEQFENLHGFLEHVSLIMDNETEDGALKVSIMTLHASKGLEFQHIYLPGWEDGLFPSQRSMDEQGRVGLEEERRLAYVGITRAEQLCTISFVANRRIFGQWQSALPSRFIDELPEEHVEILTPPGLYGGSFGAAAPNISSFSENGEDNESDTYNSPGWRRMKNKSRTNETFGNDNKDIITIDTTTVETKDLTKRIFHQKFGYGQVLSTDGDKLTILFEKAGEKKILAKYIVSADQTSHL